MPLRFTPHIASFVRLRRLIEAFRTQECNVEGVPTAHELGWVGLNLEYSSPAHFCPGRWEFG